MDIDDDPKYNEATFPKFQIFLPRCKSENAKSPRHDKTCCELLNVFGLTLPPLYSLSSFSTSLLKLANNMLQFILVYFP